MQSHYAAAFALLLLAAPTLAIAEVVCPRGVVNDSAPGLCGAYADYGSDGLCDLSQEQAEPATTTTVPPASGLPAQSASYSWLSGLFDPSPGGYDFLNVSALMLLAYSASFILYARGVISLRAHRMVWNLLLLFTFLVCAVLGVLLILKINYGIVYALPLNMLYWHVEAGIAMTVISVFHIAWHRQYFKAVLSQAFSGTRPVAPGPRARPSAARRRGRV